MTSSTLRRYNASRPVLLVIATILLAQVPARADFTLTDGNSSTTISERNGMTVWRVNNTADNVFLSNYYLRIGPTGNDFALSDLLGAPTVATSGSNGGTLTYANQSLRAVVKYTLAGGATGTFDSLIASSITLTNLGPAALDIHVFQYSDFDIRFDQANQRDQIRYLGPSSLIQYRSGTPYQMAAGVLTPPTHYQATSNFLDFYFKFFLDQDGPTTLNDTPAVGTLFPEPASDSAFAFQWDRGLASGGSFQVESTFPLSAVPEPSSLALVGIGLAAAAVAHRRLRTK